jgi:trehalose 6-phosphate phosphatase
MNLLTNLLDQHPLGLVFDIDGTLSELAPTPDAARLYPGVAELLLSASQYAHVAVLTGRAIESGAKLVNVEGLTYIGTHGAEWSEGLPHTHKVELVPEAEAYLEPGRKLMQLAQERLGQLPGVLFDQKLVGGSVHYRLAPEPEKTRIAILNALREDTEASGFVLNEGKMIVDIKPQLHLHKGLALRRFVERHQLRGILFAGDDRTDLDAVLEIANLHASGLAALAVVVESPDVLPALIEHADLIVGGVPGMVTLLGEIVQTLREQALKKG